MKFINNYRNVNNCLKKSTIKFWITFAKNYLKNFN